MNRREQREQIFKILFGVEFYPTELSFTVQMNWRNRLDYIWRIWETSAKKMPTI